MPRGTWARWASSVPGRPSRTFITEGLWNGIRENLKAGDTVLIQFGHNDAGRINENSRARGSIPTLGEETGEIDNQVTGNHEVVHTFGWYMRKMITETRARGAPPIVLSMAARNGWPAGQIERKNTFCSLAREVTAQTGVDFIPIRQMNADQSTFHHSLFHRIFGCFYFVCWYVVYQIATTHVNYKLCAGANV